MESRPESSRRSGRWLAAVALSATLSVLACAPTPPVVEAPTVVFLVRHAEKVDASADPELSQVGAERAVDLAAVLRDSGIERIHSSDYIRTRDTAAPLAVALGLEVELYDPRDLEALAVRLEEGGGRHLVVGHSNTTPNVVELLGGEPGAEIDEASEYDRLYVVTIAAGGVASTVLLRYGARLNRE